MLGRIVECYSLSYVLLYTHATYFAEFFSD
jgi:hypothetical protein